jgi:hypothetical protein
MESRRHQSPAPADPITKLPANTKEIDVVKKCSSKWAITRFLPVVPRRAQRRLAGSSRLR